MTGAGTRDDRLEPLLAERAIERVLHEYCRGIDRMDRDLVRACYHDDAVDTHGSFEGDADAFVTWVWRLLAKYDTTMHFLGNILIDLDPDDTDVAVAETYGIAFHSSTDPDPRLNLVTGFRYADRFERRSDPANATGHWRIARRVATTEWVRRSRPEDQWPIGDNLLRGRRDRDDVIYRVRGL
jgi:hypothetical protein